MLSKSHLKKSERSMFLPRRWYASKYSGNACLTNSNPESSFQVFKVHSGFNRLHPSSCSLMVGVVDLSILCIIFGIRVGVSPGGPCPGEGIQVGAPGWRTADCQCRLKCEQPLNLQGATQSFPAQLSPTFQELAVAGQD